MGWREDASRMFFREGRTINDISDAIGISRQSVSACLKQQPGYGSERQKRKDSNALWRKEYKKQKNREYRSAMQDEVTAETMRKEHDMAAAILSRERYYG